MIKTTETTSVPDNEPYSVMDNSNTPDSTESSLSAKNSNNTESTETSLSSEKINDPEISDNSSSERNDNSRIQAVSNTDSSESKDVLNPTETIEYFGLSRRKFYSLLNERTKYSFIVLYGSRKLIIKSGFEKYLNAHPELRRCK